MQDQENQEIQPNPVHKYFNLEEGIFALLVILSLLGSVITDFNQHDGYAYWTFTNEVEHTDSLQEVINQVANRNAEALTNKSHS